MKRKFLILGLVVAAVAFLFRHESLSWRGLQWNVLWSEISEVRLTMLGAGFALFYATFPVRSWRWKVLMRPVGETNVRRVLGPTFIGFTAMTLLGKAGEFIRPYLLARKEDVPVSSQLAVWVLERVYDLAGFTLLLLMSLLFSDPDALPELAKFRHAAFLVVVAVAASVLFVVVIHRWIGTLEARLHVWLKTISPGVAKNLAFRLSRFAAGLKMVKEPELLFKAGAATVLMWLMIAASYAAIVRAFPEPLASMPLVSMPLLMGVSILGSLLQLPAGTTSQLAIIAALLNLFHIPGKLAVSCGIMLWLGEYMAPIPVGLVCLHREHLSLRTLAQIEGRDAQPEEVLTGTD